MPYLSFYVCCCCLYATQERSWVYVKRRTLKLHHGLLKHFFSATFIRFNKCLVLFTEGWQSNLKNCILLKVPTCIYYCFQCILGVGVLKSSHWPQYCQQCDCFFFLNSFWYDRSHVLFRRIYTLHMLVKVFRVILTLSITSTHLPTQTSWVIGRLYSGKLRTVVYSTGWTFVLWTLHKKKTSTKQ